MKRKYLYLAAGILTSASVFFSTIPTSAANQTPVLSANNAAAENSAAYEFVSSESADGISSSVSSDSSASSLADASGSAQNAESSDSSQETENADTATDIGENIQEILTQTAALSGNDADLTDVNQLKNQIADTAEDFDDLSEEEQQIYSESRKALENAEASVDSFQDALTQAEETGTVTIAQDQNFNSWRYVNGQPVADAIDTVENETAAVQALHEGEPDTVVQALKNGEASVVTGETEAYHISASSPDQADGILLSGKGSFGVDVSFYQGNIDWAKAKADGVTFAILRVGYGDDLKYQDDTKWERNAAACEKLGIPYGVYLYSYATNSTMVKSEISHTLRLLKGHHISLPVFYDMEDNDQSVLSASALCNIANQYCAGIAAAGYKAGIYSSKSWWEGKLSRLAKDETYYHWVAQWNSVCDTNAAYQFWQNSSTGKVDGIKGNVDTDYSYMGSSINIIGNSGSDSTFSDVKDASAYYYAPVYWAQENNITSGVSSHIFGTNETCTRGQIVTFLYRMLGNGETPSGPCPFSDVPQNSYYYNAVNWAYSHSITTGTSASTFSPDQPCTRAQIVTFLYNCLGKRQTSPASAFQDVAQGDYYYDAVNWAVSNSITSGTSSSLFSPDKPCTRAQAVTFLYRAQSL